MNENMNTQSPIEETINKNAETTSNRTADHIDLDKLKASFSQVDQSSQYQSFESILNVNSGDTIMSVGISMEREHPDEIRIRVSGDIPIPVDNGIPVIAKLDRESTISKEAFMNLDADGLRELIKDTTLSGHNLTKDEIERRNEAKTYGMFAEIGAKFDQALNSTKNTFSKYFDGIKPTLDIAKENIERSKIGIGFMKASELAKDGQERIAGIGKNISNAFKTSMQRANDAFETAKNTQSEQNMNVKAGMDGTKAHMEAAEKSIEELSDEITRLSNGLKSEIEIAEKNGGFSSPELKENIENTWLTIQDKMKEFVQLRDDIEKDVKLLDALKSMDVGGEQYVSPRDAAAKAMRESYRKDLVSAYDATKSALAAQYETGKIALSGMIDTLKDANKKFETYGKPAYVGMENQLSRLGRTGMSVMQAMELKASDYLKNKAFSMEEKYQYRAEVRASAKNFINALRRKDTVARPEITKNELTYINRLFDLSKGMEERAEATGVKIAADIRNEQRRNGKAPEKPMSEKTVIDATYEPVEKQQTVADKVKWFANEVRSEAKEEAERVSDLFAKDIKTAKETVENFDVKEAKKTIGSFMDDHLPEFLKEEIKDIKRPGNIDPTREPVGKESTSQEPLYGEKHDVKPWVPLKQEEEKPKSKSRDDMGPER